MLKKIKGDILSDKTCHGHHFPHLPELITVVWNVFRGLASLESLHGGRNELMIMNDNEHQSLWLSLQTPRGAPLWSLQVCDMVAMMLKLTG